jgi:uncharacterized membrane protein
MKLSKDKLREIIEEELKSIGEAADPLAKYREKAVGTSQAQALARAAGTKGLAQKVDEVFAQIKGFVDKIAKDPKETDMIYKRLIALARKNLTAEVQPTEEPTE